MLDCFKHISMSWNLIFVSIIETKIYVCENTVREAACKDGIAIVYIEYFITCLAEFSV